MIESSGPLAAAFLVRTAWIEADRRAELQQAVTDDVDTLWALVAGVMLLATSAGVVAVVEGFTRRRTVSTGVSRYLGSAAGVVVGSTIVAELVVMSRDSSQLWLEMTAAVLATTVGLGGIAERATLLAHVVLGAVIGGVVSPVLSWAQRADGVLSSISIGTETFVDAAAASLFSAAGWIALVGIMIIGPRRGRVGAAGQLREIPGKSMPAVAVGSLVILATVVGVAALPSEAWNEMLPTAARAMLLAGAIGALVAAVYGWLRTGTSSTSHVARGSIAGLVSTAGAPLLLTPERGLVFGAIGALLALTVIDRLEAAHIDDPAGVVGVFGAAGIWGSLAVGLTNSSQLAAQLIGLLIIAAWVIVVAGLAFGILRVGRVLRLAPDVEIVGLDH